MTSPPTAITIGSFDGVHVGHAALVRAARERVGPAGRCVALAFDPHPREILSPDAAPPRLTTFDQRRRFLLDLGADEVLRLETDRQLLGLSAEAFVRHVVDEFAPVAIVEGDDFRFGRARQGGSDSLERLASVMGFESIVVREVDIELADQSIVRASSTLIRWLLEHGRIDDAARVLGRPYELSGTVVRGDRRGRSIGFPTANIDPASMTPARGVYAGIATLSDGREAPAAINVGRRPTFRGVETRVEAHLLGLPTSYGSESAATWAPIEGLDEYGWPIGLRLVAWLRDEVRFGSIDELRAQLARDVERAREALMECA